MKINEVITESVYDPQPIIKSPAELAEILERDCSQVLNSYRRTRKVLWRGMNSEPKVPMSLVNIRYNRRPVEMDMTAHYRLKQAFDLLGLRANRTNSVFCSTDWDTASTWGKLHVIFFKDAWVGTVFNALKDDYAFSSLQDVALRTDDVAELADQIKQLQPDIITPGKLDAVLNTGYKDILITGTSYYAIRYSAGLSKSIFEILGIDP